MTRSTRDYFDRMAGGWDKGANADDLCRRLESMVAGFGIPCGGWVLDVGTGTGILHSFLLAAVGASGRVLALDFSSCMLSEALKKSRPENLACFQADVTAIPLADGTCDCVVCLAAFPHFHRKQSALREMARVAMQGGRVVIAHLMSRGQIAMHHDANPEVAGHYLPPAWRMRQLFSNAGLEAVEIQDSPGRYLAVAEKPVPAELE
jgi:ubiquinone/menaquinone biosynthesis C-methylase UbiE